MRGDWPDLATLELLVAVADHGSVGAAARSLDMAQPNASRALRALEAHLRLVLLRRGPHGSVLTPDGERIVTWARATLGQAGTLLEGAELLRRERTPRLVVAATPTIAEQLAPMWVSEFRTLVRSRGPQWFRRGDPDGPGSMAAPASPRTPADVEVTLQVGSADEVARMVARGEAAVGFAEEPSHAAGVAFEAFTHDRLAVHAPGAHPWARRSAPVRPQDLARTPLVLARGGIGSRPALVRHLGLDLASPRAERTTDAGVLAAISATGSPGVVSTLVAAPEVHAGRLVPVVVAGFPLVRPLAIVWPKGGQPAGLAGEVVAVARAHARRHTSSGDGRGEHEVGG